MKTITTWVAVLGLVGCCFTVGCDMKPEPIRVKGRKVKVVSVNPDNAAEQQAVTELETARVNYHYRLTVLKGYYDRVGMIEKYEAATNELKNLTEAQWFEWGGAPQVVPPEGEAIEGADERLLVEYVVSARNAYKLALSRLYRLYLETNQQFKADVIQRVAERLDFIHTYAYFPEAEIPPADLRPVEVIPQADNLYKDALSLHRWGKVVPLMADYKRQREALNLLLQLVKKYPRSTKIALSAFYIGEIYKEYFNQDRRAVRWYERAWQWDSTISKPARFQAAVVWDLRLKDEEKALELYKQVIEHERFNLSNVIFAQRRIEELTKQERGEEKEQASPTGKPD
jgi:TolA-binding protein